MEKPIITVENLGKAYHLGLKEEKYPTFRDALVGAAAAPFRRLRHISGRAPADDLFWALRDVSFEVKRGEVVGIIGRNGAGKSTLLKILSRITEPTAGRAVLRGRVASLLEVGTGFHPELTGRENIYLNGSILGMRKFEIDRKFDEIVAFADVERFLDTPVKHYSSGMYVRLAFAVAAHLEPEILIVDEVLAVGDTEFQQKCLGKMQDIAKGHGRTVLFVSHNLSAITSLCSRALLVSHGSLIGNSDPEDIVQCYLSSRDLKGMAVNLDRFSGPVRSFRILDRNGESAFLFHSGEDIYFEIGYDFDSPSVNPVFGVMVMSENGARVFTASNCFVDESFKRLSGSGRVRCRISNLDLVAANYEIRLGFDDNSGRSQRLENVAHFQVADNSSVGTKRPSIVHGPIVCPGQWHEA